MSNAPWPTFDASKLVKDDMKIIFQVNGKLRGDATFPKDTEKDAIILFAKEQERVAAAIGDKKIVKEIYVPGKLVNLVAK